jgi:[acyl-carrier-protein] S-malonyltransferase
MFPGQSSRDPAMFERLVRANPDNTRLISWASDILGRNLRAHFDPRNADTMFSLNADVQIGVFLANHLFLSMLEAEGVTAELSLGLSLGEYNHLVHIAALDFPDALRLVAARGAAYDAGPDGMMASIFPVDLATLEAVVGRAGADGQVAISNYNSPSQFVIAGERGAVERAMAILDEEESIEGVVIEQKVPMHTERFRPVAPVLRAALEGCYWMKPQLPYLPNVTGRFAPRPKPTTFVEMLTRHVYEPVRWRESIDLIADEYPEAVFVEVGPRSVLYNLMSSRWRPFRRVKLDDQEDLRGRFSSAVNLLQGRGEFAGQFGAGFSGAGPSGGPFIEAGPR